MALTQEQITALPVAPSDTKAVAGKDTLLYIASKQTPLTWLLVGGQKNSPLKEQADSLDGSDKSSGGWKKGIPGMKSWSIEYDGLYVLNDNAVDILRYSFREGKAVYVRVEYPDGSYKQGWANTTSFEDNNASDVIQTLKVSLTGYGAISDLIAIGEVKITSPTAAFSKASAADKTVAVTPTDITIRTVTDDTGTVLVFGKDYEFAEGTLTLKKEYLKNMTVGNHVLEAKFAAKTIPITVTVTA